MEPILIVIYYRPQTNFAKVLFLQVSVCPQGVSVQGRGFCTKDGSLSRGGVSVQGRGLCPEGVSVQRVLCQGNPSPYGYVQAVRILLECILVGVIIHVKFIDL